MPRFPAQQWVLPVLAIAQVVGEGPIGIGHGGIVLFDPSLHFREQPRLQRRGIGERALADTAALQARLFAEMKGRVKEDDSTVPDPDGPFAYYLRYRKNGQHPLLCREPRHASLFTAAPAEEHAEEQL